MITVKSELHSSASDLKHEKDLLEEADALVLEGQEEKFISSWLRLPFTIFEELLAKIYTDKDVLLQQAQEQEISYRFTRETNDSLLRVATKIQRVIALALFILFASLAFITSNLLVRTLLIVLAGIGPILYLRVFNMLKNDKRNVDNRIASYAEELYQDNNHVLVIIGKRHTDGVVEALPEEIDVRQEPSKANWVDHTELAIKMLFLGGKVFAVALFIEVIHSLLF